MVQEQLHGARKELAEEVELRPLSAWGFGLGALGLRFSV